MPASRHGTAGSHQLQSHLVAGHSKMATWPYGQTIEHCMLTVPVHMLNV